MTDNMAVMYAGRIVERGPTKEIFANPRHSYTKSLLESTPSVVGDKVKLKSLEASKKFFNIGWCCLLMSFTGILLEGNVFEFSLTSNSISS